MIEVEWMHWAYYLAALLVVWVPYGAARRRRFARGQAVLVESHALGLLEPASLPIGWAQTTEPLYFWDRRHERYVPLDVDVYADIVNGNVKL